MNLKPFSMIIVAAALVSAGCSSLPGLRVLTGQDDGTGGASAAQVVEALDLVMADKTGATDPSLIAAADRIEAASGSVDVIEIRQDMERDTFVVTMLFVPPQAPDTQEGLIMQYDAFRRAFELTWQATMAESQGSDVLRVTLLAPQEINTLDSGSSFIGQVIANADINREDAALYLSEPHTLADFFNLIAEGTLAYQRAETFELYAGIPNHPMFMLAPTQ